MGSMLIKILKKLMGDNYYLIYHHNTQSLDGWFHSSLNRQHDLSKIPLAPFGTFYEFGTGGGKNLIKFLLALKVFCKQKNYPISNYRIFLFDTFEGMPYTDLVEDKQAGWSEGEIAFSI